MTQTIGQKLKQAREAQRLTLEKASAGTRIRAPYLQALETDDLSAMPAPVQARGFLRNYAEYLGLNLEHLLDEMRAEPNLVDEIIGPADSLDQVATPLSTPELDSTPQAESQPEPVPEKPKRRGRKKVEPEHVVEPQPEIIEEAVASIDPDPVVEESVESQPQEEATSKPDVNESLWQTWLNRLRLPQTPDLSEDFQLQEQVPAPQNLESTQIFKEIGADLRKRRELLSLHLGEVERNTHVKAHYLEALEKGAMDDLPSTVQTRGMLSNYATFLDLDVDVLLLRYADALQARHREKNPQRTTRKPGEPIVANTPAIHNFIAGDMIFGVGMARMTWMSLRTPALRQ